MTDKVIVCRTYRRAIYEWQHALDMFPSMWIKADRRKLTLVSIADVRYTFKADMARELKGLRAELISIDEFVGDLK